MTLNLIQSLNRHLLSFSSALSGMIVFGIDIRVKNGVDRWMCRRSGLDTSKQRQVQRVSQSPKTLIGDVVKSACFEWVSLNLELGET